MTKRKGRDLNPVPDLIRLLVAEHDISSGEVARAAGVSRQAAHYHLARMLRSGELERHGAGRSARYSRSAAFDLRLQLAGLEEDRVWHQVRDALPPLEQARDNVRAILSYAFTEMLNNAIDHSAGTYAKVMFWIRPDRVAFEVRDDGIGAFRHIRNRLGLEDDLAALQQLTKGRETTAPERHTGEGIFFTSRMVDRFEIDANGLRLIVEGGDFAVGGAPEHSGTRVRCEIDPETDRTSADVFDAFVDPDTLEFSRTVVPLKAFQQGDRFVSRSEAKRLGTRLDRFREAALDFAGITEVGQGFLDELFRVWTREHPDTRLVPINMSPVVERLVLGAMTRAR